MMSRLATKGGLGSRAGQKGAILIISLIVLMAFTVFVVSMINTSGNSFAVIGNQQVKKKLDNAAKEAIEMTLNSQTQFTNSLLGSATVQNLTINGYTVRVTVPYCYGAKNPPGYSALSAVAPEDTHWKIDAVATDPLTGASSTVSEGVKIRLGAGNCGTAF